MLDAASAVAIVGDRLLPAFTTEKARLDRFDAWYRHDPEAISLPRKATPELRALAELSRTPWVRLVVDTVSQQMAVDGYRSPVDESDTEASPWALWLANRLDGRQVAVHKALLTYGITYATALPGVSPMSGERTAVLRGVSPRRMMAFYLDPAEDDWPHLALRVDGDQLRLYDDEKVHGLARDKRGKLTYVDEKVHGLGVCPVVRFTNQLDLDGRSVGEIEPIIPLAKRLDRSTYDRLLIQHHQSWQVRTATGLALPDSEEEANRVTMDLNVADILIADDPDVKFGTLPATPLDGIIRAYETDLKSLAAASQTPVYALIGDLVNLSAEALNSARSAMIAKVAERQQSAGQSWAQLLRLGAHAVGDRDAAMDDAAHVTWADTSIRSLAEAADGLGKIAAMLGVPQRALWAMIPGVGRHQLVEWAALADAEGDGVDALLLKALDDSRE